MLPGPTSYSPSEIRPEESQGTRKVVGIVLIAVGTLAAIYILQRVFQILSEGSDFPLIQRLTAEATAIRTLNGEVVLPENFFVLAAYGVAVVLLMIASGLAKAFIQTGAQLLQSDLRSLVAALREDRSRAPDAPPPGRP
jgi:hypothetical protein